MNEIVTEATSLNSTHLLLKQSLPKHWGKRLLVRIAPIPAETEHLRELEAAYLTMSEQERQTEVAIAEEGLQAQPDLSEIFPEEIECPWWE
jgi:hypothetical protein